MVRTIKNWFSSLYFLIFVKFPKSCNFIFSLFFVYGHCPCPKDHGSSPGLFLRGRSRLHSRPRNIQSSQRPVYSFQRQNYWASALNSPLAPHCFRIKPFAMTGKADLSWPGPSPTGLLLAAAQHTALLPGGLSPQVPCAWAALSRHLCTVVPAHHAKVCVRGTLSGSPPLNHFLKVESFPPAHSQALL